MKGLRVMNSTAISAEYLVIAYTRNVKEDYSEFLGHSIHFAVSSDSGKTVIPLYHNYGRLFPKCEFSDENGIISIGVRDIEIYRITPGVTRSSHIMAAAITGSPQTTPTETLPLRSEKQKHLRPCLIRM